MPWPPSASGWPIASPMTRGGWLTEDAAARLAISVRTLQRLTARYVGLPPTAMIRRRRLQEAAERVRLDSTIDLATLAAELGYADHSHLTKDFQRVLAMAPSEYRRHVQ